MTEYRERDELADCDYCGTSYDTESGDGCPGCAAYHEQQKAYGFALFRNQPRYTREDIESCYSEPCEYQKRIGALRELGL